MIDPKTWGIAIRRVATDGSVATVVVLPE